MLWAVSSSVEAFQLRAGLKVKCCQRLTFGDAGVAERRRACRVHTEVGGKVGEPG